MHAVKLRYQIFYVRENTANLKIVLSYRNEF